ncbi:30S ribosomal protein S18 [bacterium]|nr:MAG: 30S ribosomal protein S18 [bacterium]
MSILKKAKYKPWNKTCPFGRNPKKISYKDIETLKKYLSPRGRIFPSQMTGVSAICQRALAREVKKARHMALLPFVNYDATAQ